MYRPESATRVLFMIIVPSSLIDTLSFDSSGLPFFDQETDGCGDPSAAHFRVSEVPVNVSTVTPTDPVTGRLAFNAMNSSSPALIRGSTGAGRKVQKEYLKALKKLNYHFTTETEKKEESI